MDTPFLGEHDYERMQKLLDIALHLEELNTKGYSLSIQEQAVLIHSYKELLQAQIDSYIRIAEVVELVGKYPE